MDEFIAVSGFQWDEANTAKSWLRHDVAWTECEQVFFNLPLIVAPDEPRYYALGRTNGGRFLFVVFTLRGSLIRVISARAMSRRERKEYEHAEKKGS
jgi:hypothetical protein